MIDERRQYERHVVSLECAWEGTTRSSPSRISDLGLGGCYVESLDVSSAGAFVELTTRLQDVPVTFRGRVVHARRGIGFAVRFEGLDQSVRQCLDLFFATVVVG